MISKSRGVHGDEVEGHRSWQLFVPFNGSGTKHLNGSGTKRKRNGVLGSRRRLISCALTTEDQGHRAQDLDRVRESESKRERERPDAHRHAHTHL